MKNIGTITISDANKCHKFKYLEREVPHLRGMKSKRRGNRAWIDYVGVSADRPVLGEIKCGSDQNPFYAFIQLLTYLSEIATPKQLQRSVTHKLFGDSCKSISCFDLHILLADPTPRGTKWKMLESTKKLVVAFKKRLSSQYEEKAKLLGRIICLSTKIKNFESGADLECIWEVYGE